MKSPPADGTGGDVEFTENKLCGIFIGPGQSGATSIVNCNGKSQGLVILNSSDSMKGLSSEVNKIQDDKNPVLSMAKIRFLKIMIDMMQSLFMGIPCMT